MALERSFDPKSLEISLNEYWLDHRLYQFEMQGEGDIFSIDTPPPTVSGFLHLGHVYSYSHTDFIARFRRMRGWRVFYPMGFDDNGLPTERFLEKNHRLFANEMSREAYIDRCLNLSESAEREYKTLWERLGLSVDWNYSYRTIDLESRRISQWSFLDLYHRGHLERRLAPGIWCPECQASFAQADLNDMGLNSEFITIKFQSSDGSDLPIATTRPELLAACVAVFVHPEDTRFTDWVGRQVIVPVYGQSVLVRTDPAVDPQKGTGAVMCCTFGDVVDVGWWYAHNLDLIELISPDGRLLEAAGPIAGMGVLEARKHIKVILWENRLILAEEPINHTIRVHERCDTPVEFRMLHQWFVKILDHKEKLLELGERLNWIPAYMHSRYRAWVDNLNWDWCLSRQRSYGVPFPVWYCQDCGEVMLAEKKELPVDPIERMPDRNCPSCGGMNFIPERDVLDTWATSSMSPQIVGRWSQNPNIYDQVYPFSMRPQAHDIIRTWVFYTVVKSYLHFGCLPWSDIAISGWGIAGEGTGKISKSKGGGPLPPLEMIERYSADAVRYWAASTGPGKDAVISEEKIRNGKKLVKKLWNVARFSERFLEDIPEGFDGKDVLFSAGDRWILACTQQLIRSTTDHLMAYDYAAAKSEIETFLWRDFTDNYLEMSKQRLYERENNTHLGAVFTLKEVLQTILKLWAPFLPFVTEKIYLTLFGSSEGCESIHCSKWPEPEPKLYDPDYEQFGRVLIEIAHSVRRYKSQHNLSLGHPVFQLQLATANSITADRLLQSVEDIKSITRSATLQIVQRLSPEMALVSQEDDLEVGLRLQE